MLELCLSGPWHDSSACAAHQFKGNQDISVERDHFLLWVYTCKSQPFPSSTTLLTFKMTSTSNLFAIGFLDHC